MDLLFEDIQLAQPSSVAATPVFWNKIYSEFKANVNALVQSGHEVRKEHLKINVPRFPLFLCRNI